MADSLGPKFIANTFQYLTQIPDRETGQIFYGDGIAVGTFSIGSSASQVSDPRFLINGEYPFQLYRYTWSKSSDGFANLNLKIDGNDVSTNDYIAFVSGFDIHFTDPGVGNANLQINTLVCMAYSDSGIWKVRIGAGYGDDSDDQEWYFDVVYIKKGLFSDNRGDGSNQAGAITLS